MFNSLLNRLTRSKKQYDDETRIVYVNEPDRCSYPNNRISNTKYTVLTFLPKNLLEQFGRFMNIYFLLIACLQLVSALAPVNPATTWVPLGLIFAISALKEAVDDYYRYKADKSANNRMYWILSPEKGRKVQIKAESIQVGNLVYLRENDEIPCDLVILKTADTESHTAYVQTANLDGETDLKTRVAVRATATMSEEQLLNFRGTLECAGPNAEIYKFDSRLRFHRSHKVEADNPVVEVDDFAPPRTKLTQSAQSRHSRRLSDGIKNPASNIEPSQPTGITLRSSGGFRPGHRRAASSGRALQLQFEDQPNSNFRPLGALNVDADPPAKKQSAHRRVRSLGGGFAFDDANDDRDSPFYIPEHKHKRKSRNLANEADDEIVIPLDPSHTAWQATTLKNVAWIVGVAVYTGNETKVGMNKTVPPSKWTKIDSIVNRSTIAVFILQIVLTILLGATGDFWKYYNSRRHWYLFEEENTKWYTWLIIPLRFLLLMSLMIPISLKVTLDAVKYVYALLINWDMDMVDPETGVPAHCNSSALSEDLGQIDYIFSDKTGTLTENVMVFAQCSIGNVIYDGMSPEDDLVQDQSDSEAKETDPTSSFDESARPMIQKTPKPKQDKTAEKKVDGPKKRTAATDSRLKALLAKGDPLSYDFCRILALCNTAVPAEDEDGFVIWKCASPDEEALVAAASDLGFTLKSSRGDELVLHIDPTQLPQSERRKLLKAKQGDQVENPPASGTHSKASAASKNTKDSTDNGSSSKIDQLEMEEVKSTRKKKRTRKDEDQKPKDGSEPSDPDTEPNKHQSSSQQIAGTFKKLIQRAKFSKDTPEPENGTNAVGEEDSSTTGSSIPKKRKKKVRIATTDVEEELEPIEEDLESGSLIIEKYTVLHILEFTSDRKRMSVLLRNHATNQLVLLIKGADDKILAALAPKQHKKKIVDDVEYFAQLGLRTLCLAQRIVSESEYARWSLKLNKAATALRDREQLVAEAYAEIETDFQFVGITAIEDKLQQGVPETIELLRKAGIKVWMLTGDKHATAVQIATSCNLISPTSVMSGEVFTIEGKTFDTALASLNATIAKVLPLTRGMGATSVASSTGIRLNSFFDQPQAYNYQHLALKTAAQQKDDDDLDIMVEMDPATNLTLKEKQSKLLKKSSYEGSLIELETDKVASESQGDQVSSSSSSTSSPSSSARSVSIIPETTYVVPDDISNEISSYYSDDDQMSRLDEYDEEEADKFQAEQYYQQYHDQQFHQPGIDPATGKAALQVLPGLSSGAGGRRELSIVVEGSTLTHLLRPACRGKFLQLALQAHTVICCRVTPQQKGQVVELVKHGVSGIPGGKQERTTLAIGDGGNDVSMIQSASVGIGLVGREGLQAARASDFSLSKFRFLAKLVLVHGRWSYRRTAFVAHYCFHKSLFIAFMQIFYAFFSGFAGTSFFDAFALASYNVAFTGLPILFYSFDKDINEQNLLLNPQLYHETQSGRFINTFTLLYWFIRSLGQSALVFFTIINLSHARAGDGITIDQISLANMAYGACVIVQTLTIFIESNQLTYINHIVIWGTLVLYFLNMLIIDVAIPAFRGVIFGLFADPVFWFGIFLAVAAAILPIIALKFVMFNFFPTRSQLVQRMEALNANQYEEFAETEGRRRKAKESFPASKAPAAPGTREVKKKKPFLFSSIYKKDLEVASKPSPKQEPQTDKRSFGKELMAFFRRHPSTLHRTTPATPEELSDNEGERSADTVAEDSPRPPETEVASPEPQNLVPSASDETLNADFVDMENLMGTKPINQPVVAVSSADTTPVKLPSTTIHVHPRSSSGDRSSTSKNKSRSTDRTNEPGQRRSSSRPSSPPQLAVPPADPTKPNFSLSAPSLPLFEPAPPQVVESSSFKDIPSPATGRPPHRSGSLSKQGSTLSPKFQTPGSTSPVLRTNTTSPTRRRQSLLNSPSSAMPIASHESSTAKAKASPIPSLSQQPRYSLEAGHAGILHVVPLSMLGKKNAMNASLSALPKIDEASPSQNDQNKKLSSSYGNLPNFVVPSEKEKSPVLREPKRPRSKSHTPKAITESKEMIDHERVNQNNNDASSSTPNGKSSPSSQSSNSNIEQENRSPSPKKNKKKKITNASPSNRTAESEPTETPTTNLDSTHFTEDQRNEQIEVDHQVGAPNNKDVET